MSALERALIRLDSSIAKLDDAAQNVTATLRGKQRDLFGTGSAKSADAPQNIAQANVIARRLDRAIEKVEQILGEAAE
jgi:hypothetical protein